MNLKILSSVILVALLSFQCGTVKSASPLIVVVSSDAFVEAYVPSASFGNESYLKVADSEAGFTFAFLMFNLSGISYVFNASSEIKLRLYCLNVTSPHVISVHWCLNSTWSEDNLTFDLQYEFLIAQGGSDASVSANSIWYEWTVTDILSDAIQKVHFERLTLVLRVEESRGQNDYALFYSKDQQDIDHCPQLVFSYTPYVANPWDTIFIITVGAIVVIVAIFTVYMFTGRKRKREKHYKKIPIQRKPARSVK